MKRNIYKLIVVNLLILLFLVANGSNEYVWAEEKITYESFCWKYAEYMEDGDFKGYYKYVKSLDGKKQNNGLDILCALNGKTRKITKPGKYSVIVGGTTVKKDNGKVKFVAPISGKYKFTFDARKNVAMDDIIITQKGSGNLIKAKVDYHSPYTEIGHIDRSTVFLLSPMPDSSAYYWNGKYDYFSNMVKISGTVYLKKGQYICLKGQSGSTIGLDEKHAEPEQAYNFAGYDLIIEKVNGK